LGKLKTTQTIKPAVIARCKWNPNRFAANSDRPIRTTSLQNELKSQASAAKAERDTNAVTVTQLQAEIENLKAAASAKPKPQPDEVVQLTQRNAQLQRQLDQLRRSSPPKQVSPPAPAESTALSDQSLKVLLHIYKKGDVAPGVSKTQGISEGIAQYNLDKLTQAGLIILTPHDNGLSIYPPTYETTPKGRAYVVEHGLDKGQ
jgi:hypothetical protein